jgi:tyrosine-protein phosphatase non-receptor type 9
VNIENDKRILKAIDVMRLKISSGVYLKELEQIKTVMNGTSSVATLPENRRKSRIKKNFCYDHSRVRLKHDDNSSDFINANYVDGHKQERKFILTQGL